MANTATRLPRSKTPKSKPGGRPNSNGLTTGSQDATTERARVIFAIADLCVASITGATSQKSGQAYRIYRLVQLPLRGVAKKHAIPYQVAIRRSRLFGRGH